MDLDSSSASAGLRFPALHTALQQLPPIAGDFAGRALQSLCEFMAVSQTSMDFSVICWAGLAFLAPHACQPAVSERNTVG